MATFEPEQQTIRVPGATQLGVGESQPFWFERGGYQEQAFVLRLASGLVAYVNRCPHWNVDLDLGDERFYDAELDRIYCKNHGATFVPDTGECDYGPCAGARLEKLAVSTDGADVLVRIERLVIV